MIPADIDKFILDLRDEIDARGYSVQAFVRVLNSRHPVTHRINLYTMYRIFDRDNKKPNRRHLWMLCDWIASLDIVVPSAKEFAVNYLNEIMRKK